MKNYLKEYFKLLKFAKSYLGVLGLATLCMGLSTLFEGVTFTSLGPILDRICTDKPIVIPGEIPQFLTELIARLNAIKPASFLKFAIIFLPILFLLKGITLYIQEYLMNVVGQGVVREVRNKLYSKLQTLSMEFYGRKRSGDLMSRLTNDVMIITNSISYGLKDLIFESMKVVFFGFGAVLLGFKISWSLPLAVFVIFPAIMYPVIRIGKRIKKFSSQAQKRMADLYSGMAETISGIHIVKAFCRESQEIKKFKDINYQYYRFNLKMVKRTAILGPLTEFIGVIGIVFIFYTLGSELISGKISFGIMAIFIAFLSNMIRPMKKLSNVHAINQRALAASARIYDILEEEPKIKEKPRAHRLSSFDKAINFEKVFFQYSPDDGYVLKNINLRVKKGQTIALVGHSGVGKTTLVNLVPRFYDPQEGAVRIDDKDLKEVNLKSLRSLISIVSQETVLFNASLNDNIAYGRQGAKESEIISAAKKANAYEFIVNTPDKFETVVGDRGFRLSGGEKQRVAIARAILKDAPILILDEATSNLDSASEQLIQEALYALLEGRTSFIIAHRLSTVQRADKIVVMDKGEIVEAGTHSELLSQNALYKKLYDLQFNV